MMEGAGVMLPAVSRFASWVRELRFDVIHVHHRRLAGLVNGIRHLTRVPVLFTSHSTFRDERWFRQLAPMHVTGVSPSVVDYLRRATRASHVRLIYNPVPFKSLSGLAPVCTGNRAVSIGRLDPLKGYDTLIDAWAVLRKRGIDAHLDIFGEGSYRESIVARIEHHGLQDHVRLCGFAMNVSDLVRDYAFHVLASAKEGFPNAVVEAAAHNIPTLLTNVDGSRDALPPDVALPNGLPFGDVKAFSNALEQWFASPALKKADGQRFYEYLHPRCTPEIVGRQYLDAYAALSRS
jgi:glycosyltransferase involved in cell wall biosynthesis